VKKNFLKISAMLMASLVLFSTLSFTIQKHLCADEVADVAIFGTLERCEMPDDTNHNESFGFTKKSCCQDETHFVEGYNKELKTSSETQNQTPIFAVLLTYAYLNLFESVEKDSNSFLKYSPPLVFKDTQVLYATFLI